MGAFQRTFVLRNRHADPLCDQHFTLVQTSKARWLERDPRAFCLSRDCPVCVCTPTLVYPRLLRASRAL